THARGARLSRRQLTGGSTRCSRQQSSSGCGHSRRDAPTSRERKGALAAPKSSRWTLVATIVASSMTFIDMTVVNVALPALQQELHATITDVQWVIEAYALFLGALILCGGSLGDQFGRTKICL